jgi:hypothetical protein
LAQAVHVIRPANRPAVPTLSLPKELYPEKASARRTSRSADWKSISEFHRSTRMLRELTGWFKPRHDTTQATDAVSVLERLQTSIWATVERDRKKDARHGDLPAAPVDETHLDDLAVTPGPDGLAVYEPEANTAFPITERGRGVAAPVPGWFARWRSWFGQSNESIPDRRREPRVPFGQQHETLQLTLGVCAWPAAVADISRSGIGLTVGVWQKAGSRVKLSVADPSRKLHWSLPARVLRTRACEGGLWHLSCLFISSLSDEELEALS